MNESAKRIFNGIFLVVIGCIIGAGGATALSVRRIAEGDKLVGEYRNNLANAAWTNRRITERVKLIESGLEDIRGATEQTITNIRGAIGIIERVKSVIDTLEEVGAFRHTGGALDWADGGAVN